MKDGIVMNFIENWFFSVIPIFIAIMMFAFNSSKMAGAYNAVKGVIRTRQDLDIVRDAINVSMILAIIYMAMFAILIIIGLIMIIGKNIHPLVFFAHLFFFGLVALPMGLIGKTFENRIKNLKVESTDPYLKEKFQDYLVQWNQPRLKLAE